MAGKQELGLWLGLRLRIALVLTLILQIGLGYRVMATEQLRLGFRLGLRIMCS